MLDKPDVTCSETPLELGVYGMSMMFGGMWDFYTPYPSRTLEGTEVGIGLLRMDDPLVWQVRIMEEPSNLSFAALYEITLAVDRQVPRDVLV